MISVFNTGEIKNNGIFSISQFNGEILKVIVFSKQFSPSARIEVVSMDNETICDDNLNDNITKFYPKNIINVSESQTHLENYFVFGTLEVEISGLGEGEVIDNIAIYYK